MLAAVLGTGVYAAHYDLPIISTGANGPQLENKDIFSTLIRISTYSQKYIGQAFLEVSISAFACQ